MKKSRGSHRVIVAAAATIASLAVSASAATVTWTGAVDNTFGTAENWDTNAVPGTTDDVVIAAPGATNVSPNLLGVARTIESLTFNATPGPVNIIADNVGRLTVNGQTGDDVIVLGGDHIISSSDANVSPNVGFRHGGNFTFNIASGASLDLQARLGATNSGNAITVTGGGTLMLSANNGGSSGWNISNTTGAFNVTGATVILRNGGATGNSANRFTINNGGVWLLEANHGAGGDLTLNDGATLRTAIDTRSVNAGAGSVVVNGTVNIDTPFALNMNQDFSGAGTINKTSSGTLHLNGTANTFTGTVNVNEGQFNIDALANANTIRTISIANGARLNVTELGSGYSIANSQTIQSGGRILGTINTGNGGGSTSTLAPGTVGTAGTMVIGDAGVTPSNLNLNGGRLLYDLAGTPAGTSDLITVDGNLTGASATRLSINRLEGTVAPGSYRLIDYTVGTLDPSFAANLVLPTVRQGLTLDTATANQVNLVVGAGAPASLSWVGDGSANVWNTNAAANWLNGAAADVFFDWDDVSFTESGSASPNVDIQGVVAPTTITVDSTSKNYTFGGAGTLAGVGTLTKNGSSTLILANADGNNVNTVDVNGGTLQLNNANNFATVNVNAGGKLTFANTNPNSIGTFNIAAGATVEIGDGVTAGVGNAGSSISNNQGTVVYNHPEDWTVSTAIGGDGTVEKKGAGVATVTANSTYTGATLISAGTLKPTVNGALGALPGGAVTIANGAALDLAGATGANALNFGQKQFNIIGAGTGTGAITNSGAVNQQNVLQRVALTGDASVGGTGRFDIRAGQVGGVNVAVLDLAGNTLTKVGPGQFSLVAADVGNGNIVVNEGNFSIETTSNVTGTGTITYNAGTTAQFFRPTNSVTKPMIMNGITVSDNNQTNAVTIASPLTFNGANTFNIQASTGFNFAGGISETAPSSLTKTGAGKLILGGASNKFTGGLTVSAGNVEVAQNNSHVVNTGPISLAAGTHLDLKDNKLVTTTPVGTPTGGVYDGLHGEVQRAYASGAWTGDGLMTSMPEAGPTVGTTTIGVASAQQILFIAPTATGTWAGQEVTGTTALAMYTYAGDLNFDGRVDAQDYGIIDNWVQFPGTSGYANGDINYDGVIDAADYGIIDNTIQLQGTPIPSGAGGAVAASAASALSGVTAVPEPASLGAVILAAAGLLGRRRRRPR